MIIEIKVPSPGESITEVQLASWLVEDGDQVEKDDEIAEIDSDKATLTISADEGGKISLKAAEGDTLEIGAVLATVDTEAEGKKKEKPVTTKAAADKPEVKEEVAKSPEPEKTGSPAAEESSIHLSPLARKLLKESGSTEKEFEEFLKKFRAGKKDVEFFLSEKDKVTTASSSPVAPAWGGKREEKRQKLSTLRMKLAERLVSVKNETAMLTTFNEVNMTPVMEIRKNYKDIFKEKFGVGLGFMSFFTKAVTIALHHFPKVNAQIDGNEMVMYDYADVGIAVSAPKGLMVPVLRNAEQMSLAEIESKIKELAIKARDGKLSLDEMKGGTFTITNGGVFGSMLSTPIINPPQSAILGMHNIVERPIAVNGKVEIHPIMYVALSYDHRIIDGAEAVGFLVKIKEVLEDPTKMLLGGTDPAKALLQI
ncbi:MAG: 2-oxoglutarate dehydrogenase complex dihydrolipoyllysine-residue succinyltransferase [Bacteroidales bacterium]|jgi:2-oxoglutarate dehydrogenase E2 component (dihydrolipoamide succinyltransferase)|nr:2-oxoglutarate dehydrogenase complex dihydrolipoyllysine-residue succinyltransferase [Bacteroidales bacterium]